MPVEIVFKEIPPDEYSVTVLLPELATNKLPLASVAMAVGLDMPLVIVCKDTPEAEYSTTVLLADELAIKISPFASVVMALRVYRLGGVIV